MEAMVLFIWDNGGVDFKMVKVMRNGQMELNMKVIIKEDKNMAKENTLGIMGLFILVIGKKD